MTLPSLPGDKYGVRIQDVSTKKHEVDGIVTDQVVFAGEAIISHITIWADVDGGTIQLKDNNGEAITPAGKTDYGGSYRLSFLAKNGCKVTTTGFTGGKLSIYYTD